VLIGIWSHSTHYREGTVHIGLIGIWSHSTHYREGRVHIVLIGIWSHSTHYREGRVHIGLIGIWSHSTHYREDRVHIVLIGIWSHSTHGGLTSRIYSRCAGIFGVISCWIWKINNHYFVYKFSNIWSMPMDFQGPCGRDRMVVEFRTTYPISSYHHWCCEFESRSGRGVQHYVIKFVSDLRQVGGFLRNLRFPPPIKLTATHDIAEILLKVALSTTTLTHNLKPFIHFCWKWR
jgi:hypothetical protein